MKKIILLAILLAPLAISHSASAASCREGQEEVFWERADSGSDALVPVRYVCRNGRFVKKYPMQQALVSEQR